MKNADLENFEPVKLTQRHLKQSYAILDFLEQTRRHGLQPKAFAEFKYFLDDNRKSLSHGVLLTNQIQWLYEQLTTMRGGVKVAYARPEDKDTAKLLSIKMKVWAWAANYPSVYNWASEEELQDAKTVFVHYPSKPKKVNWEDDFKAFIVHLEAFAIYYNFEPFKDILQYYHQDNTLMGFQWDYLKSLNNTYVRKAIKSITQCEDKDIPKLPSAIFNHLTKYSPAKVQQSRVVNKLLLERFESYGCLDLLKKVKRSKLEFIDTLITLNDKGNFFMDEQGQCYDKQPGYVYVTPIINSKVEDNRKRLHKIRDLVEKNQQIDYADRVFLFKGAQFYRIEKYHFFVFGKEKKQKAAQEKNK